MTVLARVKERSSEPSIDYRTHEAAFAHAHGELAYYREMERQGVARILTDAAALNAHMDDMANHASNRSPLGFVLTMEGADPIVEPEHCAELVGSGTSRHFARALRSE